jgi:hypothetical protein
VAAAVDSGRRTGFPELGDILPPGGAHAAWRSNIVLVASSVIAWLTAAVNACPPVPSFLVGLSSGDRGEAASAASCWMPFAALGDRATARPSCEVAVPSGPMSRTHSGRYRPESPSKRSRRDLHLR